MRRLLSLSLAMFILALLFAAVSRARADDGSAPVATEAARSAAPLRAPAALPERDATNQGYVYGFRTSAQISATMEARDAARAARSGTRSAPIGGGNITVTARVLPGIVVELDRAGHVQQLTSNTPERDIRNVLFVLPRALDAATWSEIRSALARAGAGTGVIWHA